MEKVTLLTVLMSLIVMVLYAKKVEILANTSNPLKIESTSGNSNWISF